SSRVGEDDSAQAVADHRKADLRRAGQEKLPTDGIVIRAGARADPAEGKSAHRSDAAGIKVLVKWRAADDESGVAAECENRLAIQQILAERFVQGAGDAELVVGEVATEPAGRFPTGSRGRST